MDAIRLLVGTGGRGRIMSFLVSRLQKGCFFLADFVTFRNNIFFLFAFII